MAIQPISEISAAQPANYVCGNCGRVIGALEQPYQWGESVVCPQCCAALQEAAAIRYEPPRTRRKGQSQQGLAIAGFVLAFVFPLLGLIFSIVALNAMKRERNYEGKGMASAGLVLSIVFLAIGLLLASLMLSVFSF